MVKTDIRVSHIIWGYLGGGVDSVLNSYLDLDDFSGKRITSHIVIIQHPNINSLKKPQQPIKVTKISHKSCRFFKTSKNISRSILNEGSEVVFMHGFNASILGIFLNLFLPSNIKFISTFHGTYPAKSFVARIKGFIFNFLELIVFKYFVDKVISVSKYSSANLVNRGLSSHKIQTIHNGIVSEGPSILWHDREPCEPINFITVSRLAPEKDIDILIAAFSKLLDQEISARLMVVGDGPLMENLVNLVEHYSIEKEVKFYGDRADVANLLILADIFVMSSSQENHSIAVLESMRASLPSVLTDVGGNSESVTNNKEGLFVKFKDIDDLSLGMSKLANSFKMRKKMGLAAKIRFESKFTSDIMLAKLEKLIIETLKTNN